MSTPALFQSISGIRWVPRIATTEAERQAVAMVQQLQLPDMLARVLAGRGVSVDTADAFLKPTLKALMPDPSHLRDMDKAVARITRAIEQQETIAIFGDYDVDGATSSALLSRYFSAIGREVLIYIPDRMKEGYGPNLKAFETLRSQGATLIITVDCGTVAFEPIAAIKLQGVDVVVIDHHMAEPRLPNAQAVVNPNRIDQDSDCGHLAAVGVTLLLLVALNRSLREAGFFAATPEPDLLQWLDLVALGTVCDVVPLKGLNRALVAQGLKVMTQRRNQGIAALCDVARMNEPPSTYHAGFLIGPRINAGGRVGESWLGSQILSCEDPLECAQIAATLDAYNAERQAIEAQVLEEAVAQAERQSNQPCLMVASQGWHEGVIGIVAGRLKEQFERPAIVIAVKDGIGKASARSVTGADIGAAVVSACTQGLLLAGGGHAMAAGFSLSMEKAEAVAAFFSERLSPAVSRYALERVWLYDALVTVDALSLELIAQLDQAGPFGMGNPSPRCVIPRAKIVHMDRMKDKHLRLVVTDESSRGRVTAVAFNSVDTPMGTALESGAQTLFHLAGTAKCNRWNGRETVQFLIDDIAVA